MRACYSYRFSYSVICFSFCSWYPSGSTPTIHFRCSVYSTPFLLKTFNNNAKYINRFFFLDKCFYLKVQHLYYLLVYLMISLFPIMFIPHFVLYLFPHLLFFMCSISGLPGTRIYLLESLLVFVIPIIDWMFGSFRILAIYQTYYWYALLHNVWKYSSDCCCRKVLCKMPPSWINSIKSDECWFF